MPTPEKHALLSASSSHRWLICTAAPHFEAQFPESTSEYAEEGRLAHSVCELKLRKKFIEPMGPRKFTSAFNKLKENPLYDAEMDATSDDYLDAISEIIMSYNSTPGVAAEVQVDFSDYVPEGFGTCDCVIIGGDTLSIVDYKHGKGVAVSAEDNTQMRLYALGALNRYRMIYGDTIQNIRTTIVQPRISDTPSSETLCIDDLLKWGEHIKPIAEEAFTGPGTYAPGEHCRFCRGKAQCRARSELSSAYLDFKDIDPNLLSDAEIGELLTKCRDLVKWYGDIEEYALSAILAGKTIDGWKVVAGRSNREFTDTDKAMERAISCGYDESLVYERKPKTLTALEKLMGKDDFAQKLGDLVVKPYGKPTLVPISDKREPYSTAASDFKGVINE